MTKHEEDVLKAAMDLSVGARAELIERLIGSLTRTERESIDRAWAEEAERRLDVHDRGQSNSLPGEEVMGAARKRLGA